MANLDDKATTKTAEARKRLKRNVKHIKVEFAKDSPKPKKQDKFDYGDFWGLVGAESHTEFEACMREMIFDREKREAFYRGVIALEPRLSVDSFKPYFELYSAERKTNQQDYTPESVASLLSVISRQDSEQLGDGHYTAYDMTAGTGTLLINKWNDDRAQETPWAYAPHRYFYRAEEFADNAIPYLIHNLAMRGMNAIVIQCDSITRVAKQAYFIQNSQDDFMAFSDINVIPHTKEAMALLDIRGWKEEAIDHVESEKVLWQYALPPRAKTLDINQDPPAYDTKIPWADTPRLKDIAFVERAKKGKTYPQGSIVIQMSATKGQVGLLKSNGEVGSQYAVAVIDYRAGDSGYWFYYLKQAIPKWFRRVQEGLNAKLEDIADIPVTTMDYSVERVPIKYGQQSLF